MIQVTFTEPTSKKWLRWRRDVDNALQEMLIALAAGRAIEIKERLYKRCKDEIFTAFHGKCAYCECDLGSQHGEVEHYRPKRATTDLHNKPVHVTIAGTSQPHPGYFWIAYDWHNLVPACSKCNQQPEKNPDGTMSGKGNRFPVAHAHGFNDADPLHTDLTREQPLLLHPCVDNPADHLTFIPTTGALGWITPRGEKTIDILGLNREWLCDKRRETYQGVVTAFVSATAAALLQSVDAAAGHQRDFDAFATGAKPFSFAGRAGLAAARARLQPLVGHPP